MDPLLVSAASGMKARMESLDLLANNVANTGTVGFKADREFYGLFQKGMTGDLPLVEKHWTDFSQGQLLPTGNPLDLALDGQGFLALNAPPRASQATAAATAASAGAEGRATGNRTMYTRGGHFQISRDNQLATSEGYTLRDVRQQGRPITVDPGLAIEIDGSGIVRQEGRDLGQIEVVGRSGSGQSLAKLGSSYFARTDFESIGKTPTEAAKPVVKQATLEQSNVGATDAAVRLVSVMRQFEMMQRAMTLGSEMNKRALDEVARVA